MVNCLQLIYVCSFSQTISEWNYQLSFTVIQEDEKKKSDGGAGEGGAGEDPPKKKYEKMPKWQKWSYIISVIMMGGLTIANGVLFSLPDKDENDNDVIDEYSSLPFPSQYYQRLKSKIFATKKSIEEPFSDRLLPDPLEEPNMTQCHVSIYLFIY